MVDKAPPAPAAPPERCPWQPIETAPRTGVAILLCCGNWMTVGHWHRIQGVWASNGPVYSAYARDEQPTHWMPLPGGPDCTDTGQRKEKTE